MEKVKRKIQVLGLTTLFGAVFLFAASFAVGTGMLGTCETAVAQSSDSGVKRRAKRTRKKIRKHKKEVDDIVNDLEELIEELEDDENFDDDDVIDDLEEAADAGAAASEATKAVDHDLRRLERGQTTDNPGNPNDPHGGALGRFTGAVNQGTGAMSAVGRFFRTILFLDRLFGQKQSSFTTASGAGSTALRSVESYDFMVIARENVDFVASHPDATPADIAIMDRYYAGYYKFCAEFGPMHHCDLDKDGDITTLYERRFGVSSSPSVFTTSSGATTAVTRP